MHMNITERLPIHQSPPIMAILLPYHQLVILARVACDLGNHAIAMWTFDFNLPTKYCF